MTHFLKYQVHQGSNHFRICENLTEVTFTREPHYIYSQQDLQNYISNEVVQVVQLALHPALLASAYQRGGNPETHEKGFMFVLESEYEVEPFDFETSAVKLNSVTGYDEANECRVRIIFDGEAFLCNSEARTVHRFQQQHPFDLPKAPYPV